MHRPFFCLDLSYAHTLLTKGFKIPDDASITLVKKVSQWVAKGWVGALPGMRGNWRKQNYCIGCHASCARCAQMAALHDSLACFGCRCNTRASR